MISYKFVDCNRRLVMTEEQKKALQPFIQNAKAKDVHINIYLWAVASMLNSNDWKATLEDIMDMLDNSKDCDEFALRLIEKYPGQTVADTE